MCILVMLILPNDAATTAAHDVASRHSVPLADAVIPSLQPFLRANERPMFVTRGQCDCGTRLGCMGHDDPEDNEDPIERRKRDLVHQRAKAAKKGWSVAKLERWEAQQLESQRKKERVHATAKDATLSLDEWRGLLGDLLAQQAIDQVGLLIHMFHGSCDDEVIRLAGREPLRSNGLDDETLLRLRSDTLYEICRSPVHGHSRVPHAK